MLQIAWYGKMARNHKELSWSTMVDAAKLALHDDGYLLSRKPGRGLSNVWELSKDGRVVSASIRTSKDRWVAFPPLAGGKWKTLDDVEFVVIAAVDRKENPTSIEVFFFDASIVRERFRSAYDARTKAGSIVKLDFGMWIALDTQERGLPADVGSGLAETAPPLAIYKIGEIETKAHLVDFSELRSSDQTHRTVQQEPRELTTIVDVMNWARKRISEIAGVESDQVRLELKLDL